MALSADASAAEATGYGEITRFGLPASGGAQGNPKANELSEARTISIGVDPAEENSVFVLEERKEPELKEEERESDPLLPPEEVHGVGFEREDDLLRSRLADVRRDVASPPLDRLAPEATRRERSRGRCEVRAGCSC